MSHRRRLQLQLSAIASVLALGACQYSLDRAHDFADQFRLVAGVGSVAGARASSLGLYDTGLMIGMKPRTAALGWRYGIPYYFDSGDPRMDADQAEILLTTTTIGLEYETGSYTSARESFALLPALFTWTDSTPREYGWTVPQEGVEFDDRSWIWSSGGFERGRYAQIHAFDVDDVGLFVYLDTGYSPGEFLDFLLGIFLIDIARDDGRW